MKHTIRILSALLAAVMMLTFAACTNPGDEPGESATDASTEPETLDEASQALADLGDVDWGGGEFAILYNLTEKNELEAEKGVVDASSGTSQVINDAVYERNTLLEERCNLTLALVGKDDAEPFMRSASMDGAYDYQQYWVHGYNAANVVTSGMLYSLPDLGIELDAPWWDAGTAAFALNGKVFFMNGSHNFSDDNMTYVLIFNKQMAERYQVENVYDLARNGTWTLDKFQELIQGISSENGDGVWDANDIYGFIGMEGFSNTMWYGCGLQYIINTPDMDRPELFLNETGSLDKCAQVIDLIRSIYHDNNATLSWPEANPGAEDAFMAGHGLFFGQIAGYLTSLNKGMVGDYGVVPVPKYDKAQEHYITWTYKIGTVLCVPSATPDDKKELVGDVTSAMAMISHKTVLPAFYDTMLTSRNVRDADSGEMLDLIFNHRLYDLSMYYEFGFMELVKEAMLAGESNFSSRYKSVSKKFDKLVDNLLKSINKQ